MLWRIIYKFLNKWAILILMIPKICFNPFIWRNCRITLFEIGDITHYGQYWRYKKIELEKCDCIKITIITWIFAKTIKTLANSHKYMEIWSNKDFGSFFLLSDLHLMAIKESLVIFLQVHSISGMR